MSGDTFEYQGKRWKFKRFGIPESGERFIEGFPYVCGHVVTHVEGCRTGTYMIVEPVEPEIIVAPGPMKWKVIEFRPPRKGDLYFLDGMVQEASFNYPTSHKIVKPVYE